MLVLDDPTAAVVRSVCDVLVPGSGRVGPEVYIDALLSRMPAEQQAQMLGAIDALEEPAHQVMDHRRLTDAVAASVRTC